jgi:hypothetical protein cdifQCD-6_19698
VDSLKSVYPELISELARRSITKTKVAEVLGISPRTLYSKLVGATDFTLSEANTIRSHFFPNIKTDDLFRRSE